MEPKLDKHGHEASEDYHRCPYKSDVNNDPDTLCNCCKDCEDECRDEI